jgi:glucose-6-phosphate isomerase/transaldolase/glucose-6-phosphate isomerase
MRTTAHSTLAGFQPQVDLTLRQLVQHKLVTRLWAKDHTLWRPHPTEISNRLGWLTVASDMRTRTKELAALVRGVKKEGFRHVVLLGMGGSSLGPEVFNQTFRSARGYPKLWVLDSTVPSAVLAVTRAIQPTRTLFILASKSGGTIEVMSLFAHFWDLVTKSRGHRGGTQFMAITDPGTGLVDLATKYEFRATFVNPPDIGGRYSVLSFFGLVPAALLGVNVGKLLDRGIRMAKACRQARTPKSNPGLFLGAVMGTLGQAGRDKVTFLTSPKIRSFGLWAEQLLAESTGKEGKGFIPVADEPLAPISAYGQDRLFVYLRLDGDTNKALDRQAADLEAAGHPVVHLALKDRYDLGTEFFRWEFATAVAGHLLEIHPFDQPNVQEAKESTKRILDAMQRLGPGGQPNVPMSNSALPMEQSLGQLLAHAEPGTYLAILAYCGPSPEADAALTALRRAIMLTYRIPTTAGYGPRYLHSTGQLHKGGPNTGLFLQLLEPMSPDVLIPNAPYTFGMLASAQAAGDRESLHHRQRHILSLGLGKAGWGPIQAAAANMTPLNSLDHRKKPRIPKT